MTKSNIRLVLVLSASLMISGCSTPGKDLLINESINSISGIKGVDGEVLVVKIDDTTQAHPQIGIENADLVYIEQVEGGLTRLMGIFSSNIPTLIGPVRSARISDIDILAQFGRVAFAYSGAQRKLLPVIRSADFYDFGAHHESPAIYTTDPNRQQPYAMVLRADLLMKKIHEKDFNVVRAKNIGFKFGHLQEGGISTKTAEASWPNAAYKVSWSAQERRWLIWHNGKIDKTASGVVLGASTFVIQIVSITPSEYGDKFGGVTPFSQSIGSGKAYILRNGQRFEALWSRESAILGTTFHLKDGEQVNFDPGQIWVALVDTEPVFTSQDEVNKK